jgi:L-aminopeptidase/D-esterase-like protein
MTKDRKAVGPLPDGVSVGHWTDRVGRTGCTVVLAPGGAVAGVDVRGAAPGTLGTDALRPGMLVERAHAILLTGGSAFGLDAAGGIMRFLEEHGSGYQIGPVRVPIVAGAVIFDLLTGDPRARPGAGAGYAACRAATSHPGTGLVGAGTGASVAKAGGGRPRPGGLGIASATVGGATVAAIMVANSVGGIWDDERHEWVTPLSPRDGARGDGARGDGARGDGAPGDGAPGDGAPVDSAPAPGANTTIGVVVTDAELTREQASRVATVAHDGIARAVRPAHTRFDGDTMFCLATGTAAGRPGAAGPPGAGGPPGAAGAPGAGEPPGAADAIEATAALLVARAIAGAVRAGQS